VNLTSPTDEVLSLHSVARPTFVPPMKDSLLSDLSLEFSSQFEETLTPSSYFSPFERFALVGARTWRVLRSGLSSDALSTFLKPPLGLVTLFFREKTISKGLLLPAFEILYSPTLSLECSFLVSAVGVF